MSSAKVKALIAWADTKGIDLDEAHIECGSVEFFLGHYSKSELARVQGLFKQEGCVFTDGRVYGEPEEWPVSELTVEGTPWRVVFYKDKSPRRVEP